MVDIKANLSGARRLRSCPELAGALVTNHIRSLLLDVSVLLRSAVVLDSGIQMLLVLLLLLLLVLLMALLLHLMFLLLLLRLR
ncbi:MAG: hypothetical protein ACK4ZJ_17160, partial [Allorhizobium sp.]